MPRAGEFQTHCKWGHAFTADNVYVHTDGRRECRTCRAARRRRWQKHRRTHCSRGHPFDEENTYIAPGTGYRACLTCRRMTARDNQRERRAAGYTNYGWTAFGWLTSLGPWERKLLAAALLSGNGLWPKARKALDLDRRIEPPARFR